MKPRVTDIITAACSVFEVNRTAMLGPLRGVKAVYHARQVAMLLARELTGQSYPAISSEFNRRHTAVLRAYRKAALRIAESSELRSHLCLCRGHIAAMTQGRERNLAAARGWPLVVSNRLTEWAGR